MARLVTTEASLGALRPGSSSSTPRQQGADLLEETVASAFSIATLGHLQRNNKELDNWGS